MNMAMRRTIASLAIIALLLGGQALAKPPGPVPEADMMGGMGQPLLGPQPGTGQPGWPNGGSPVAEPNWIQDPSDCGCGVCPVGPGPVGPCGEITGEGYCCPPAWYLDQRIRIMHHPKTRYEVIGTRAVPYTDPYGRPQIRYHSAITSKSAGFEPSAGYEVTVGHHLGRDTDNRDHFIEFTYWGAHSWEAGFATHADHILTTKIMEEEEDDEEDKHVADANYGNLFSSFDAGVAGFNRATEQRISYRSRLDNFELNLRFRPRGRLDRLVLLPNGRWQRERQPGCHTSFLAGFRGISLDENFGFFSTGPIAYNPVEGEPGEPYVVDVRGDYVIRTRNDMIGLQAGWDWTVYQGLATWGMRCKGGLFVNFADQYSRIITWGGTDDPNPDPVATFPNLDETRLERSRDISGVLDLGLTTSYRLRQNLVLHAAYDAVFISGLALAPEQIDCQVDAPDRINNGGLMIFQSVSLGLELTW